MRPLSPERGRNQLPAVIVMISYSKGCIAHYQLDLSLVLCRECLIRILAECAGGP